MSIKHIFKSWRTSIKPNRAPVTFMTALSDDDWMVLVLRFKFWLQSIEQIEGPTTLNRTQIEILQIYIDDLYRIERGLIAEDLRSLICTFVSELWTKDNWLVKCAASHFTAIITNEPVKNLDVYMANVLRGAIP